MVYIYSKTDFGEKSNVFFVNVHYEMGMHKKTECSSLLI